MIYCTPILRWVLGIRYWVCLAWYVIRSLVWSMYCWYVMIDLILWKPVGHMEEHTEKNILETIRCTMMNEKRVPDFQIFRFLIILSNFLNTCSSLNEKDTCYGDKLGHGISSCYGVIQSPLHGRASKPIHTLAKGPTLIWARHALGSNIQWHSLFKIVCINFHPSIF